MNRIALFAAIILATGTGTVQAQTVIPIPVTQVALATTRDDTQLPYLTLEMPVVEIPKDMRLSDAYMEFYMDASSTRSEDGVGETVTLEMYTFGGATNGKLDVAGLGTSNMKRSVKVGVDRRVRLYVTDFVQQLILDPSAERRLIVGSIVGKRTARFEAKTLPGTSGTKATLTVVFSRIEDTSAGQVIRN